MKTVLVVDDDAAIRDLLRYFLSLKGYSVDVAENGAAGEALMEERRPDLIISDILMPGEDGLEFLMHTCKRFPEVPVIAISGGIRAANYDPLPIAEKLGARHTFTKPLDLNELLGAIHGLLGGT